MAGALLDDAEKRRFIEWLNIQMASGDGMAAQMEKMGGPLAELAKRERARVAAFKIVTQYISEGETFTVGKSENNQ